MRTLVYVEVHEGEPARGALGLLSKAAQLGGEVAAVICGSGLTGIAEAVARFGAPGVYVADDPALEEPLPQPRVDVLARLVEERHIDTVLFEASALSADLAGGLADRLEAGLNWDLVDLELRDGRLVGKRPALQDSVLVEVSWRGVPRLALVRPGSFEAHALEGGGEIEGVSVEVEEWSLRARGLEQVREESKGPSIEGADVIVAGGRGLGDGRSFALLEELAGELGGAVAASLPAVEIGWYPYSALVGQSGKIVSPRLYIACGISGAVQHKMGMQNAGAIVAINKDPNAPIFDFCDLAVVGDLHEIVPRLTELVRERRGGR